MKSIKTAEQREATEKFGKFATLWQQLNQDRDTFRECEIYERDDYLSSGRYVELIFKPAQLGYSYRWKVGSLGDLIHSTNPDTLTPEELLIALISP